MANHNPSNERMKRQYFVYLKEAKRHGEATVDAVAKALSRFEADTKFRDFKVFHFEQAIAFKNRLADQDSKATGVRLSKATLHSTLGHLKRFFQWLSWQPGYKSRLRYIGYGILQPVREGYARCDGTAGKRLSDDGAGKARA